jgi:hypothetical protein
MLRSPRKIPVSPRCGGLKSIRVTAPETLPIKVSSSIRIGDMGQLSSIPNL